MLNKQHYLQCHLLCYLLLECPLNFTQNKIIETTLCCRRIQLSRGSNWAPNALDDGCRKDSTNNAYQTKLNDTLDDTSIRRYH